MRPQSGSFFSVHTVGGARRATGQQVSKGLEIIRKGSTNMPSELVLSTMYSWNHTSLGMTSAGARQPGAHSPVFFRAFASQNDAKFELPPPPIYISCTLPTAALHSLRTPFVASNQTSSPPHFPNTTSRDTKSFERKRGIRRRGCKTDIGRKC